MKYRKVNLSINEPAYLTHRYTDCNLSCPMSQIHKEEIKDGIDVLVKKTKRKIEKYYKECEYEIVVFECPAESFAPDYPCFGVIAMSTINIKTGDVLGIYAWGDQIKVARLPKQHPIKKWTQTIIVQNRREEDGVE